MINMEHYFVSVLLFDVISTLANWKKNMLIMYILVVGAKSALARVSNVQEAVLVFMFFI